MTVKKRVAEIRGIEKKHRNKYHCTECNFRWEEKSRQGYPSSKTCRSCKKVIQLPAHQVDQNYKDNLDRNLQNELNDLTEQNDFIELEGDEYGEWDSDYEWEEQSKADEKEALRIKNDLWMKNFDPTKPWYENTDEFRQSQRS